MALPLSLAAWVLAPLVGWCVRGRRPATAALEGLVFVALGGMVLVHILPHSLSLAGMGALGAAGVGLGLALALGRKLPSAAGLVLAVVGLAVHAALEGRALSLHGAGSGTLAVLAVVLHRLPLGLGLWWLVRPVVGTLGASALLVTVALVGGVGLGWGGSVLEPGLLRVAALLQAFTAGAFLPALFRGRAGNAEGPAQRLAAGLGAVAAMALLVLVSHAHPLLGAQPGELGAGTTFLHLSLETAPALLAAYVLTGLFQALLGEASLGWLGRGSSLSRALRGTVVGLPLALCSCGVLPVYRGLIRKGVPIAAALSFLVAAPELGVSAVLVSVPLIGWPLTLARLGGAFVVAVLSGVLVSRLVPASRAVAMASPATGPTPPLRQRLAHGLREGLVESVDHTAPWILVGMGMAALVEPLLAAEWLSRLPPGLDVPLFALLGVPSFVCASGATPLVAVLLHKGLSPGAALAFLITGPATNVTTFAVMSRLHGRKVTLAFGAVVAVSSVGLGLALNMLLPAQTGLAHQPQHAEHEGLVEWVGLVLLGALFLASLLRQGPRGFLAQLLPGGDPGESTLPTGDKLSELHVHGPACGHDHGHHGPAHARPHHEHGPGCTHSHSSSEARAPLILLPQAHVHGPECQNGAACSHGRPGA
ncbi:permease [Archangium violaceum]|uniref:permease n=1 Tax=Archangium violaceum TaxID=83451 RepID=UPI00193B13E6|nr:permease [Archangium violaceum]QRK06810.1 permease [Archangium violaceum]